MRAAPGAHHFTNLVAVSTYVPARRQRPAEMTDRERKEQTDTDAKLRLGAAYARVADSTALPLIAASLALGWVAWQLFYHFAERIWGPRFRVDPDTVTLQRRGSEARRIRDSGGVVTSPCGSTPAR